MALCSPSWPIGAWKEAAEMQSVAGANKAPTTKKLSAQMAAPVCPQGLGLWIEGLGSVRFLAVFSWYKGVEQGLGFRERAPFAIFRTLSSDQYLLAAE